LALVAAGLADRPAAILAVNRVIASSASARVEGVRLGQRRREAQAYCPELVVVGEEPARDARSFEPVVVAVAASRPRGAHQARGLCPACPGPARYFGGEVSLAEQVCNAAAAAVVAVARAAGTTAPEPSCQVGIADGPFAARLAAREGLIVPRGATPEWLGHFAVEVLGLPMLADVLRRLGIRTLGESPSWTRVRCWPDLESKAVLPIGLPGVSTSDRSFSGTLQRTSRFTGRSTACRPG